VFATVLSLASIALGQSGKKDVKGCNQTAVNFQRTKDKGQIGEFVGVLVDPLGAVVPGAMIKLVNAYDKSEQTTKTNDEGVFTFKGVKDGTYSVNISAVGFKSFVITKVELSSNDLTRVDIHLALGEATVTMGVIATMPEIEHTDGTMIIRGDAIRKLPLP